MTLETVKLGQLLPPKANPRKAADVAAIEGLAASIRADGLLQNLVVRRKGRKWEIVSGERRYRAMQLLAGSGDIAADFPVAVEVRKGLNNGDALRLATVENVQREPLNAMDEAEAFAGLMNGGGDIEDIAAKAGMSALTVKRRLALAGLCAEAREMVRSGDLSLAVAEAMTLGTHEQQRGVIARLEEGWHYDAENIRDLLTGEKPSVALAIFDLERYDGTFSTDLFGSEESTFFDDAEQFLRLQAEAVEALAARHRESAAWVEVVQAGHVPWWQYDEAEDDDEAGVVIHFCPSGRVEVREGLAEPTVSEKVAAETAEAPAAPKPKPEYSKPMLRYIAAHKTMAVQAALLANPRKAREIAVVQMLGGYDFSSRIRTDAHSALSLSAEMEEPSASYAAVEAEARHLLTLLVPEVDDEDCAWSRLSRQHGSSVGLYQAVSALSDDDLERLHLLLTVLTFGQNDIDVLDTRESLFNRVAVDLAVDMKTCWRPDTVFLSGRRKDQLADIAAESGGTSRLGSFKDTSKTALVAGLVRHFKRCAELGDDASGDDIKGRDWLPDSMRFPAVKEDAGESAACS
ncbi:MAG: ParB/RepB/Spo0J family partition protein [Alphaproteobacteria bacterium]